MSIMQSPLKVVQQFYPGEPAKSVVDPVGGADNEAHRAGPSRARGPGRHGVPLTNDRAKTTLVLFHRLVWR